MTKVSVIYCHRNISTLKNRYEHLYFVFAIILRKNCFTKLWYLYYMTWKLIVFFKNAVLDFHVNNMTHSIFGKVP